MTSSQGSNIFVLMRYMHNTRCKSYRLEGALPRLSALKAIAESQPTHARLNWKAAAVAALELEFTCKGAAATAQTRRLLAVLRRREAILHAFCVLSGEAPLPSQSPAVAAAAVPPGQHDDQESNDEVIRYPSSHS